MGTEWLIFDGLQEKVILQSIGHVKHWPSSTRAELGAILLALLVLLSHQSANIHMDLKAAIDSLLKLKLRLKGGKNTAQIWSKTTNGSLISSIEYIINRY